MKTIFFASVALAALAAVPASAQPDGEGRIAAPQTRAAVQAQVQARFAKADSNSDGFVTQDEVRARAEARLDERREQRFEQLDSNHDGMISRAEFDAPRAARGGEGGERRAMRGERRGKRFAHRGGGGAMGAGFGGRAFAAMDMDRDGRVALDEAQRAALQRFDRVDSNRDGTITLEERQAARAAWQERREERQGD
ncbi:MAG TPA: EF-hand domain-containing protein [Allosphingosinicella sp.]|nr:EF-hand domain-containing protein [Allosphingosinicella sp.]